MAVERWRANLQDNRGQSYVALWTRYDTNFEMKRTSLKRRTPIRKMSRKRKTEYPVYSSLSRQFLFDHPVCQFNGCANRSTHVHHRPGRYGNKYTDVNEFMALCFKCHHFIHHENPNVARQLGYLKT